jgi:curved DNA-binding protein CbpA
MTSERDPYAVLGVPSTARADEIAAAYRSQARRHHPDVSVERDAERRMADINAAWTLLRDPARRVAWDRANGIEPTAPPAPRPAAAGGPQGSRASGQPRAATRPGSVTWRRGPGGEGAAGPPPGGARGSVLPFGRHVGWSIGEVARVDPGYLVWLQARREGEPYREEIERFLAGQQASGQPQPVAGDKRRRGLFR